MRRENLGRFCEITTLCMSRQPILVLQCELLVDIHHLLLSVYEAVYGVFHKRADGHGAYKNKAGHTGAEINSRMGKIVSHFSDYELTLSEAPTVSQLTAELK